MVLTRSMGDDLGKCPALELGKRTGLDDFHTVADLCLAVFVVHVVFLRAFDDFVELWMGNACDVFDDDGLFHFVGNDNANAGLTKVDLSVLRSFAHNVLGWCVGGLGVLLGSNSREDASGFTTHLFDARWIFERSGGALKAKVQRLVLQFTETDLEFVSGKLVGLFGFGFGHGSEGLELGDRNGSSVRIAGDEACADAQLV